MCHLLRQHVKLVDVPLALGASSKLTPAQSQSMPGCEYPVTPLQQQHFFSAQALPSVEELPTEEEAKTDRVKALILSWDPPKIAFFKVTRPAIT